LVSGALGKSNRQLQICQPTADTLAFVSKNRRRFGVKKLERKNAVEIRNGKHCGRVATLIATCRRARPCQLKLQLGMRKLQETAATARLRSQGMAFEIVELTSEERGNLRRWFRHLSPAASSKNSPHQQRL